MTVIGKTLLHREQLSRDTLQTKSAPLRQIVEITVLLEMAEPLELGLAEQSLRESGALRWSQGKLALLRALKATFRLAMRAIGLRRDGLQSLEAAEVARRKDQKERGAPGACR